MVPRQVRSSAATGPATMSSPKAARISATRLRWNMVFISISWLL
jgi:hypothetical protein